MRKIFKAVAASILLSFVSGCNNNTYVVSSDSDISSDIQQTRSIDNAEEHKMLVFADREYLYDLESGEIFYGYDICKEYSQIGRACVGKECRNLTILC